MTLDKAIRGYTDKAMVCTVMGDERSARLYRLTTKWLKELKQYREWAEDEIHSYRDTRKAINDFVGR